jgi:NADP-dependent 3-hydroxy acid dehydrogenase YdfG
MSSEQNPGRVAVITGAEQMYAETAISAEDIAEIIGFAVSRPRNVTLNEILVRPTAQAV